MTVVVDLGCASRNGARSLSTLAKEYAPAALYGFDPAARTRRSVVAGVPTWVKRSAAWIHDGKVAFSEEGARSRVGDGPASVPCFDFSAWLKSEFPDGGVVVKMDVEGAEYELLERMCDDGTDKLVSELLVEWHQPKERRDPILERLSCPVREWWL